MSPVRVALPWLLAAACVSCTTEDVCGVSAELSWPVVYEKDDFLGQWTHTATLEDAGGTAAVVGTRTEPVEVRWFFYEDFLLADVGIETVEPVVAFGVEGHYTKGTFRSGTECLVDDPRPWYERSHARIDWSTD